MSSIFIPRDYQLRAVDELRAGFGRYRAQILTMPTGSGKTGIAGMIAQAASMQGTEVLVLVHRRELIRQFCSTLDRFGIEGYGIIDPSHQFTPWAKFHVSSIQTLHRRSHLDLNPGIVIIDECHHAKARTWEEVIARFPDAWLLGLTATPKRLDGKPLGHIFDHIVLGPEIHELVPLGHLATTRIKYISQSLSTKGIRRGINGDFSQKQLGARINRKTVVSAVKALLRYDPDGIRLPIFFGVNIAHSKAVAQEFRERGIRAEHVDADTLANVRDRYVDEFREGKIRVLCNVGLFTEGTDIPMCNCILDGCPTMSLVSFKQRGGRAMRPDHGGDALYIDLAGNFWIHGRPDDPHEWDLETEYQPEPMDSPKSPRYRFRVCPKCSEVFEAANECPACGEYVGPKAPKQIDIALEGDDLPPAKKLNGMKLVRKELREAMHRGGGAREVREIQRRHALPARWADTTIEILGLQRKSAR